MTFEEQGVALILALAGAWLVVMTVLLAMRRPGGRRRPRPPRHRRLVIRGRR